MDLRDYVRILRKSWASILAFVVVGIAAGVALTLATTKVYEGTVQLIAFPSGAQNSQLAQGNTVVQAQVQSLTSVAASPQVTGAVIGDLKLRGKLSPSDLAAESALTRR